MTIANKTRFRVSAALMESVAEYPTDGLAIEIKYSPEGTRRFVSGTYYRVTPKREEGKLIRLRINPRNRYPVTVHFKTSEYERKTDRRGNVTVYQKLQVVRLRTPEDLILAVFLHEFSHYLDHIEGRNGRYKQTKADKFALDLLGGLGVI